MIELYRLSNMTFWRGQAARDRGAERLELKMWGGAIRSNPAWFADFGDNGSKGTRQERIHKIAGKEIFHQTAPETSGRALEAQDYSSLPNMTPAVSLAIVSAFGAGHVKFLHMSRKTAATLALPASYKCGSATLPACGGDI